MKVIREGTPLSEFWRGIWECQSCGRQIEFDAEDAPRIKFPDGKETPPHIWKYIEWTLDQRPYMYGPCPNCRQTKQFFHPREKAQE